MRSCWLMAQRRKKGMAIEQTPSGFVQAFAHTLAHFEKRNCLGFDMHRFAGTRIAPNTGYAFTKGKRPKAAKLYPVPVFQRFCNGFKNRIDQLFPIPMI